MEDSFMIGVAYMAKRGKGAQGPVRCSEAGKPRL